MTTSDAVLYERDGAIGVITLNQPDQRNSMSPALLSAFSSAVDRVRADAELRAVVIRGRGSCFSAGADLRQAVQSSDEHLLPHERSYAMYRPFLSVLDIEVPVIGALAGHAVGGGFGLALSCDIRIGSTTARYGANFTRLGLHPGMAISYLLPRLIGVSQAAEMLFTGRLIHGAEAARLGILSRALDSADVDGAAMELAEDITKAAPKAVRATKQTFYDGLGWDVRAGARREAHAQAASVAGEEFAEGAAALLEKRDPRF